MKTFYSVVLAVAVIMFCYLFVAAETAMGQVLVQPPVYAPVQPVVVPVAPHSIYVPRVEYVPYQYQGSVIYRRHYRTPIRSWMFGRYRLNHYYSPVPHGQVPAGQSQ